MHEKREILTITLVVFYLLGEMCLCGRTQDVSSDTGICLVCVQDSAYTASLLEDQQVRSDYGVIVRL